MLCLLVSLLTVVIAGCFAGWCGINWCGIVRFFGIQVFVAVHCIFVNGRNRHPLNFVFACVFANSCHRWVFCCINDVLYCHS